MISSIEFLSGFPVGLPAIQKNRFDFTDGLNVLWGPNACGKSTVLRTLAAYSFIKVGGWSSLVQRRDLGVDSKGELQFPEALRKLAPGKETEAMVAWDRAPVFFANGDDQAEKTFFHSSAADSPDGLTDFAGQVGMLTGKHSRGEMRAIKLKFAFDALRESAPRFAKMKATANSEVERACQEAQLAYLSAAPAKSRMTAMFDEPDHGSDVHIQLALWTHWFPVMAKQRQVIVATHSPFALFVPGVKIHWMDVKHSMIETMAKIAQFVGAGQ